MSHKILCLNNDWYDGLRRPRHILVELLARRGNDVFYVSTAPKSLFQRAKKDILPFGGVKKIDSRLYWVMPPVVFRKYYNKIVKRISNYFWSAFVRLVLVLFRVDNPVVIVTVPDDEFFHLIRYFRNSVVIYNVHDRYIDAQGNWVVNHFDLLERADIVLCGSQFLVDEHKSFISANKLVFFPPAVDAIFFTGFDLVPDKNVAAGVAVIGCIGNFGWQIDWELLGFMADNSGYDFVFVGPVVDGLKTDSDFISLARRKNVYFRGTMPHSDMPKIISEFDLCILPYKLSEYSKGINPLKLLEYLAVGKPVVSSAIPAAEDMAEMISIGCSREQWLALIDNELRNNSIEKIKRRIDYASLQSYESRVEQLTGIIDHLTNG